MTQRLALTVLAVAGASTAGAADRPPNPGRTTPPPGIESHAVAVGAHAPPLSLAATTGGKWDLAVALRDGPAVLVFYRGDW